MREPPLGKIFRFPPRFFIFHAPRQNLPPLRASGNAPTFGKGDKKGDSLAPAPTLAVHGRSPTWRSGRFSDGPSAGMDAAAGTSKVRIERIPMGHSLSLLTAALFVGQVPAPDSNGKSCPCKNGVQSGSQSGS